VTVGRSTVSRFEPTDRTANPRDRPAVIPAGTYSVLWKAFSEADGHVSRGLVATDGSDQDGLVPLLYATKAALGRKPREISADAGFCREGNLAALKARGTRGYLAPGRATHGAPDPNGRCRLKPNSRMAKMITKLKRAGRCSRYRLRKQTIERSPADQAACGFRQFLLRGVIKVNAEWALICTAPRCFRSAGPQEADLLTC